MFDPRPAVFYRSVAAAAAAAIAIFAAFLYLMFRPNKYANDNEAKIDVSKITANK